MRIGLVVDSTCDLPQQFLRDNNIEVLPITIRLGDSDLVDNHSEEAALEFYRSHIGEKGHDAESVAFTTEQICETFLGRLVTEFDYVFCQTVMQSRSPIYENATKASFAILSQYHDARRQAGVEGPFALRVINTGTLFAGQGVIAAETVRLIKAGLDGNAIRKQIDSLLNCVRAYAVPPDLYYVRARARKKGDRSVSLLSAALGSALDIKPILCGYGDETKPVDKVRGFEPAVEKLFSYAIRRIEKGLMAPYLSISYAGDLDDVAKLPRYAELQAACTQAGVELLLSVMSVTGGVNIGPGAISLGLIAEPHTFQ